MHDDLYHFSLTPFDFGQMIDGLCIRRDAWAETARWLRGESEDPFFLAEECDGEHEAQQLADHYTQIIENLQRQAEGQRP